jgi:hypothetical protein
MWTIRIFPIRGCLGQWYSTGGTPRHLRGYVDYAICITCIMYQQLWEYKVEDKLYLGVREQKRLNTTGLGNKWTVRILPLNSHNSGEMCSVDYSPLETVLVRSEQFIFYFLTDSLGKSWTDRILPKNSQLNTL